MSGDTEIACAAVGLAVSGFPSARNETTEKHRAKDLEVAENPKHNDVWSFVVPQKEGTRFQETLM